MSRNHNGGFIDQEMYWNIGSEEERGRDGDTAREAAKKFNDHRHSAFVAQTAGDLNAWLVESQIASEVNNVQGGYLVTDGSINVRRPGDLATLNGHMFMATNSSGSYIRLGGGFGGGLRDDTYVSDQISIPIEMRELPLLGDATVNLRRIELSKFISDVAEQVCFAGDFNVQGATSKEVRADIVASIFRDPMNPVNSDEALFFPANGSDGPIVKMFFSAFPKNEDGTFPMGTALDAQRDEVGITAQTGNPIIDGVTAAYDVKTVQVHPTLTDLLVRCSVRFGTLDETISRARQQVLLGNSSFQDQDDMESRFDALSELYRLDILSVRLKVILNFGEGQ